MDNYSAVDEELQGQIATLDEVMELIAQSDREAEEYAIKMGFTIKVSAKDFATKKSARRMHQYLERVLGVGHRRPKSAVHRNRQHNKTIARSIAVTVGDRKSEGSNDGGGGSDDGGGGVESQIEHSNLLKSLLERGSH